MNGISASLEGLKRAESQVTESAKRIAKLPAAFTDLLASTGDGGAVTDVVDLSAESVALLLARNAADANLAAIDTFDQVQQQILGLLGK